VQTSTTPFLDLLTSETQRSWVRCVFTHTRSAALLLVTPRSGPDAATSKSNGRSVNRDCQLLHDTSKLPRIHQHIPLTGAPARGPFAAQTSNCRITCLISPLDEWIERLDTSSSTEMRYSSTVSRLPFQHTILQQAFGDTVKGLFWVAISYLGSHSNKLLQMIVILLFKFEVDEAFFSIKQSNSFVP